MKVQLQTIDEFTEDVEDCSIDPWYQDKIIIAAECGVSITDVDFKWYSGIGETAIFVKGKYHGYASDIWDCFIG